MGVKMVGVFFSVLYEKIEEVSLYVYIYTREKVERERM